MDRTTPWQHLLHNLLPSRGKTDRSGPDFMDTCPAAAQGATSPALRPVPPPEPLVVGWAESAIDLAEGTEIMEYPEDTAADLMDEFFAKPEKRAA